MTDAATTLPIKPLLREFLDWLEGVSMGTPEPGSAFELLLDAGIVAKAQGAVDLALASGEEITLCTNGIPARAVVANVVFYRAGFGACRMAQGELTENEWDSLIKAVKDLADSRLVLTEDGVSR